MRAVHIVIATALLVLCATGSTSAGIIEAGELFPCDAQECRPNGSNPITTVESCLKACNGGSANECKDQCVCSGTAAGSQCAGICRKNKSEDECGSPVRQKCVGADLVCDKSTQTPLPTSTVPTTAVPTTAAPTTAVPTTAVPTTAVPTTDAPTTTSPASTTSAPATTTSAAPTPAPTTSDVTTPIPSTTAPLPSTTAAANTTAPTTTSSPATTDVPTSSPSTTTATSATPITTTSAPAPSTAYPTASPTVSPTGSPVTRPPAPPAPPASTPTPSSGTCAHVSVVGDATYCVSGAICGDLGRACPKKGDVAATDCNRHLTSYVQAENKCVARFNSVCQPLHRAGATVYGCVFDPSYVEPETTPAASREPHRPCTEVSVAGDATYCIPGSVCGGNGTNCPKKGDVASKDCLRKLRSYEDAGRCVAPADAVCQNIHGSVLGCVFP